MVNEAPRPKKLLDPVRDTIRLKHYSYQTEVSDGDWIRRFILFHDKHHSQEMRGAELETFLAHLVVKNQVVASRHSVQFDRHYAVS